MFSGFTEEDFTVFEIEGLEARMQALKTRVSPKFEEIGKALVPDLSAHYGEEFYAHVAKHARRTTNPPNDSWVSFATNPRGYKMLPHFQVGLWSTRAFVMFAIIYECVDKQEFGEKLARNWPKIKKKIPKDMLWYDNHVNPKPVPTRKMDEHIDAFTKKLINNKNGELLVGIEIPKAEAVQMTGEEFLELVRTTIYKLDSLYLLPRK